MSTTTPSAAEIERIVDEQAVRDVHLRYCRGVDRQDWDLVRSVFHPGARDNHGPYNGEAPEGFIAFAKEFLDAIEGTTHFTGNQLVEVDGDLAWHEAYCVSYERMKATDDFPRTDRIVVFRYFDQMERRQGRWGIVDRVVIIDSERQDPVPEATMPIPPWHWGSADKSDPSYNRTKPQAEYLGDR